MPALLVKALEDQLSYWDKRANPEEVTISEVQARDTWETVVEGGWVIEDWHKPDYEECFAFRREVLARIRSQPDVIPALKLFYKNNPAQFISDWGTTTDPRNIEIGLPSLMPFLLFPKQGEWVDYVIRKWRDRKPGLTEKSRDCGISWLAIGLGATMCLHYTGMTVGYGSRKAEYVDKKGQPKSLFWKARKFMEGLPPEFNGGYDRYTDAPLMRINFRETGSVMTGEGGASIGRGDRTSIYFVDEAAWLEQPAETDAALSATTNCQIDVSSVHGMTNTFATKRHSGKVEPFIFDWRDDPRKDDAWYQKQVAELDEVIVAQEINRDYSASVAGIIIPSKWVQAAIDAHLKLKVDPTGRHEGALDVADGGKDGNAYVGCHGVLVNFAEEWSGKGSDIYSTVERAFGIAEDQNHPSFRYDADGLGAGVKGDARKLNEERARKTMVPIVTSAFRGSEGVYNPDAKVEYARDRTNKDFFQNHKAQGWWALRERFRHTFRAVVEGAKFDKDRIISISSGLPLLQKLVTELSQPTIKDPNTTNGKIQIDKAPDGTRSPNLADGVMMLYAPMTVPMIISPETLRRSMEVGGRSRGARRHR